MSKQFINEVSRMKDLFGYKKGQVISEQKYTISEQVDVSKLPLGTEGDFLDKLKAAGINGNSDPNFNKYYQWNDGVNSYYKRQTPLSIPDKDTKQVTQPNSSTDPFAAYPCVKKLGPIKTENRDGKSMKFVQAVNDNTDVNIGGFNYTLSSIKFFENGDAVIGGRIVKKFSCGSGREIIIDNVKITPKQITKPVVQIPKELKDVEGVKKFQDWMDTNHSNWVKGNKNLNKGGGYGKFGPSTSAAWKKYKDEYLGGSKANTGGLGVPSTDGGETITPTDDSENPYLMYNDRG
jgi:hypothetical protein